MKEEKGGWIDRWSTVGGTAAAKLVNQPSGLPVSSNRMSFLTLKVQTQKPKPIREEHNLQLGQFLTSSIKEITLFLFPQNHTPLYVSLTDLRREEKMERSQSSSSKLERRTLEKNRRMNMKNLCFELSSLIPSDFSKVC